MGGAADTGCWAGAPSPRERAAARIVECDPTACPGPETWCDPRPTAGPGGATDPRVRAGDEEESYESKEWRFPANET